MIVTIRSLLTAALLAAAAPAVAAEAQKPAAAPAPSTTIGLQINPEFFGNPAEANFGQFADYYLQGTITQIVAPGWAVSGDVQITNIVTNSPPTIVGLVEGSVGYTFKLDDKFSLGQSGGLGFMWGNTGYTNGLPDPTGDEPFAYYYLNTALDYQIDSKWTWNLLNARFRQGFGVVWMTEKLTTGVTYAIDDTQTLQANTSFFWKDSGAGFQPGKLGFSVGYNFSF